MSHHSGTEPPAGHLGGPRMELVSVSAWHGVLSCLCLCACLLVCLVCLFASLTVCLHWRLPKTITRLSIYLPLPSPAKKKGAIPSLRVPCKKITAPKGNSIKLAPNCVHKSPPRKTSKDLRQKWGAGSLKRNRRVSSRSSRLWQMRHADFATWTPLERCEPW